MNSLEKEITSARKARKRATSSPSHVLAAHAVDAMLDKKAHDVTVMDMREVSGVADYFVLGTGDSDIQIKAIADEIRERIKTECQERPWHTEGTGHHQWVLLDYVDVVAHIFDVERRGFYDLERLWGDAPRERVPEDGSSADVAMLKKAAAPAKRRKGGAAKDQSGDAAARQGGSSEKRNEAAAQQRGEAAQELGEAAPQVAETKQHARTQSEQADASEHQGGTAAQKPGATKQQGRASKQKGGGEQ